MRVRLAGGDGLCSSPSSKAGRRCSQPAETSRSSANRAVATGESNAQKRTNLRARRQPDPAVHSVYPYPVNRLTALIAGLPLYQLRGVELGEGTGIVEGAPARASMQAFGGPPRLAHTASWRGES